MPKIRIKQKNVAKKGLLEKPENAVIYTRVSTEEQAKKGYSLDKQQEDDKKFAENNGINVIQVFCEEGQSAKTLNRTELQKMLKFCQANQKKIKYLIVWKQDRLSRCTADMFSLRKIFKKLNIEILYVTESNEKGAAGELQRNVISVMSQYENDVKSERTVSCMQQALKLGRWLWRPPFGYKTDKNIRNIVPNHNSEIVKLIFKKFASGCYSQAEILTELKRKKINLRPNHLCKILRNPIYCGWICKPDWFDEPIKGSFKAIISEKTFNTAQDILDGRKPVIASHDFQNEDYPLKQFLRCPYCGKPLTGSNSISQRGKRLYQYYACYNKECPSKNKEVCKSKFSISKDEAERAFTDILTTISPKDEVIDLFKSIVCDVFNERTYEEKIAQNKMQQELEELLENKKSLVRKYTADKIQEDEYNMVLEELKEQEQKIRNNLQVDILTPQEFNKFLENSLSIIQNLSNAWNDSVLRIKKNIQNLIFPNGLSADFSTFQNSLNPIIFKQIGTLSVPYIDKLPPSEFESLSTP